MIGDIWSQVEAGTLKVIGFDCEWKLPIRHGIGGNMVDVIQLAIEKKDLETGNSCCHVYIFHVAHMRTIPPALSLILGCERVIKVGNRIHCDVTNVKGYGVEVLNVMELGHEAFNASLSTVRNPSLDYLVDMVLKRTLPKKHTPRLSDWRANKLSKTQQEYCALDAQASLQVYTQLQTFTNPITSNIPRMVELTPMKVVHVYNRGLNTKVAIAHVAGSQDYGALHVERMHDVVLVVDEVLVPSTIAMRPSLSTSKTLGDMSIEHDGQPFIVVWRRVAIRPIPTNTRITWQHLTMSQQSSMAATPLPTTPETTTPEVTIEQPSIPRSAHHETVYDMNTSQTIVIDPNWRNNITQNDLFHVFQRFDEVVSKRHAIYKIWCARFSDAMYVPDTNDLDALVQSLRSRDKDVESVLEYQWRSYVLPRIRRYAREPKDMITNFVKLVHLIKNIVDERTGLPFMSNKQSTWNLYIATIDHMKKGCFSDVPGVHSPFTIKRVDKHGLNVWHNGVI